MERLIGEGSFGKVYAGTCRGAKVAIKVPLKKLSEEERQELRGEVAMLSSIYHPNVVLFMGACTREEEQLMIVTELKDCTVESLLKAERERRKLKVGSAGSSRGNPSSSAGNPTYFLNSPASPSGASAGGGHGSSSHSSSSSNLLGSNNLPSLANPLVRMKMARDTALGTNWLHNISHIIHRDLKTANLLWDSTSGRVCVTDFGLSQALAPEASAQDRFGPRGSALFMAPEVIRQLPFDHRIDTYSFGIILWELWTCEEPFADFYDFETFVDAVHVRGLRPPIASTSLFVPNCYDLTKACPPKLASLIKSCWHENPQKRPQDFESILHSLDEILVDMALSSVSSTFGGLIASPWPSAASFWFNAFCKDDFVEKVSWIDFITALDVQTRWKERRINGDASSELVALENRLAMAQNMMGNSFNSSSSYVNINDLSFDLLAPYICTDNTVSLSQFAECVEWFGEFPNDSALLPVLYHLFLISRAEWFFGAVTRQQAEAHINSKETNPETDSFLIRLSASFPGSPFTLTRPAYATRRPNLRIRRTPDPAAPLLFTFAVEYGAETASPSFPSLPALISGLRSELRLYHAAPPLTPYEGGY